MAVCVGVEVGGRRRRRRPAVGGGRRRRPGSPWRRGVGVLVAASPSPWPPGPARSPSRRARRRRAPAQLRARSEDLLGRQAHRGLLHTRVGRCREAATPLNFGIARPALEHARSFLRCSIRLTLTVEFRHETRDSRVRACHHRHDARGTLPTRRARRRPARGGGRALAHLDAHPLRAPAGSPGARSSRPRPPRRSPT